MDCILPGSSVHGISQARVLEWVAFSPQVDLPDPGVEPMSPALAGGFFTTAPSVIHPPAPSPGVGVGEHPAQTGLKLYITDTWKYNLFLYVWFVLNLFVY